MAEQAPQAVSPARKQAGWPERLQAQHREVQRQQAQHREAQHRKDQEARVQEGPGLAHFPALVSLAKRLAGRQATRERAGRAKRTPALVTLALAPARGRAAGMPARVTLVLDSLAVPTRERVWRVGPVIPAVRMREERVFRAARMAVQLAQVDGTLAAASQAAQCPAVATQAARCPAAGTLLAGEAAGREKITRPVVAERLVARLGAPDNPVADKRAAAVKGAPTRTHPTAPHERF